MTGGPAGAAMRLRPGGSSLGAVAVLRMVVAGVTNSGSASAETSRFRPWTEASPAAFVRAGCPTSMANYRGKVAIVIFWGTWCEF